MGSILSGPKAPDNSAALAEIERNRKETERVTKEAQDDRRTLSEQKMAKKRASRYGGKRSLLSDSRLLAETGIDDEDDTLGSA